MPPPSRGPAGRWLFTAVNHQLMSRLGFELPALQASAAFRITRACGVTIPYVLKNKRLAVGFGSVIILAAWLVCSVATATQAHGAAPAEGNGNMILGEALGHVDLQGGLRAYYEMIEDEIFTAIGMPCLIAHAVTMTEDGHCRSRWIFRGINTYLVPKGRDDLMWQPTYGNAVVFKLNKIESAFPKGFEGDYAIRRRTAEGYEIKNRRGTVWYYEAGVLASITDAAFGEATVTCKGTFISAMQIKGDEEPKIIIIYDHQLLPLAIIRRKKMVTQFQWTGENELSSWTTEKGTTYNYSYDRGLVNAMWVTNGARAEISWKENAGWQRGDTKWPGPIHLAKFGGQTCEMKLESRGLVLEVRNSGSSEASEIIYNPLNKNVIVNSGGKRYIVPVDR